MDDAAPTTDRDADRLLVQRAQGGDFEALEALVTKYERRIYGLGRRIVGQDTDAQEVVQQTFLSVVEHLETFRGDASFLTWLTRIATNHALALLRKRRRRAALPLVDDVSDDNHGDTPHPQFIAQWHETPEDLAARRETRQLVEAALAELDEKYRLVFVLRDIEGLSTAETAEMLGISTTNAKVRLMRARLMLRERLTQAFGDVATQVQPHDHEHDD